MDFERERIVYGVDVFPDESKNNQIKELLKQPFQPINVLQPKQKIPIKV